MIIFSNSIKQIHIFDYMQVFDCNPSKVNFRDFRKVPKFSDNRKLCFYLPKIQTKKANHRVFRQKDANGIANSEDPL